MDVRVKRGRSLTKLSVNLNAVAYLRNRRDVPWPDLLHIAAIVLDAGASGITVHPRPDERHIRRADVYDLQHLLSHRFPDRELNIEGYPTADFLALVAEVKPHQVTLVPDDPAQSTSDHGWDLRTQGAFLQDVISGLRLQGARVSLFVDPDPSLPALAKALGADRIEIYTGPYGGARSPERIAAERDRIAATAAAARAIGKEVLGVNAGHDLTAQNLPPLIQSAPGLAEVSIGHGLTADALILGFGAATKLYLDALG
jgi:pyridoxine 5-phosphate synthase